MLGFIKSLLAAKPATTPAAAPAAAPAPAAKPAAAPAPAAALFVRHFMAYGANGVDMGYHLAEAIAAKAGSTRRELEVEDLGDTPPLLYLEEAGFEVCRFTSLDYRGVLTPQRFEEEVEDVWRLIIDPLTHPSG